MIIFGMRAKPIQSSVTESLCEHCGQYQQAVHTYQKYFHIFWVPVFPTWKVSVLECQHCRRVKEARDMSAMERARATEKRREAKTPLTTFVGAVLIALFIGYAIYDSDQEEKRTQAYISLPAANDLAVIEVEPDRYQILKLVAVGSEVIQVKLGTYVYGNLLSAKRAIDEEETAQPDYFLENIYEMPSAKYREADVRFVEREES